jgi:hypothetical protein
MVRARLHIICGNCGCNDMFEYGVDMTGHDFGDRFEYSVSIKCDNCGTIHDLDENGGKLEIENSNKDTAKNRLEEEIVRLERKIEILGDHLGMEMVRVTTSKVEE